MPMIQGSVEGGVNMRGGCGVKMMSNAAPPWDNSKDILKGECGEGVLKNADVEMCR